VIALVATPIVILTTLYWIFRLVRRTPLLTINADGIIDHSSFVGAGLVKWDEIKQITIRERTSNSVTSKLINIVPVDIKTIQARQNALTRLNEMGDNDTIQIGTIGLPVNADQLLTAIKQYYTIQIQPT